MTEPIKMLKIWLACLQPSLGVLGMAMLLCSPLCANAAEKAPGMSKKSVKQQLSTGKAKVEQQIRPTEIAITPDMAVRQLAIRTLRLSGVGESGLAIENPQFKQNIPSKNRLSTKRSINSATRSIAQSQAPERSTNSTFAPGTFEFKSAPTFSSNSDLNLSSQFSVNSRSTPAKIVSTAKRTETALPSSSDPFSLILPQLRQVLGLAPQGDKTAKMPNAPVSNDPVAAVPKGLQELLGGGVNVSSKVKTIDPNANALTAFLSPPPSANSGVSLNLSTAKAYATVPKFDIPTAHRINKSSVRQISADLNIASTVYGRNNLGGLILGDRSEPVYSISLQPITGSIDDISVNGSIFDRSTSN